MFDLSTLTRGAVENVASDFLFERFEKRYSIAMWGLVEMIEGAAGDERLCLTQYDAQEPLGNTFGAEAFAQCIAWYRETHGITEGDLAEALRDYREMNGPAPAQFAEAVIRHLALGTTPTVAPVKPATSKSQNESPMRTVAVQRHAEARRDQAAALDVVRVTNGEIKALRKECADARRFTPADKQAVYTLVVRQVAEKAVLAKANDAVRAAKAGIKDAAIAEVRARRRAV